MGSANWYKWLLQLALEKLIEKITPETLEVVRSAAIKAARDVVAAAKASAATTANPWDDLAASAASQLVEAVAAASGTP